MNHLKEFFIFLFIVFSSLEASSNSPSTTLLGPKSYRPSPAKNGAVYIEILQIPQPLPTEQYSIEIVNGDGKIRAQKSCSGNVIQRFFCELESFALMSLLKLTRAESFYATINGVQVGSGSLLNLQTASNQLTVQLQAFNKIEFKVKGLPTGSVKVRLSKSIKNNPPLAEFAASLDTNLGVLRANFDASQSTDPDQDELSFEWSFGDGQTASGVQTSHIYQQPGNYFVQLRVKDSYSDTVTSRLLTISDIAAPVITWDLEFAPKIQYVNKNPFTLFAQVDANEALNFVRVDDQIFPVTADRRSAFLQIPIQNEGLNSITAVAQDIWGNESILNETIDFIIDLDPPSISIDQIPNLSNALQVEIPFTIQDRLQTWTEIFVNSEKVYGTGAKRGLALVNLSLEGDNLIIIKSTDQAGNLTESGPLTIRRDTLSPQIEITTPVAGQIFNQVQFNVAGVSDETLQTVRLNGRQLTLSADKKSFSGVYITQVQDTQSLVFDSIDLAGNITISSVTITVNSPLIISELISLVPNGNKLEIIGQMAAARPGTEVSAYEGLLSFNRDSSDVNVDGSFRLVLNPFQEATLNIEDSRTGESQTLQLQYSIATTLSGIILDINDIPIPGVTVKISGTNAEVITNGQGAFSFNSVGSGDQVLLVDGSTVPQSFTGPNRSFSKTSISINIGFGQSNTLERPIYLTPILLDGTQTVVIANQETTIESVHAPGVEIKVPSNSTIFPNGSTAGTINIVTIDAEKTTTPVPQAAVPEQVISLEPSGLKFNKRVELTLPNSSEMPPNTDMVIFSMNSAKGTWEIDGIARVTEDGNSVKTLPGEGISHFSLVYAVPLAPNLNSMIDSNLGAVDSSKDSYQTAIELPSFKIGDESISPKLIYKSSWANPTAYVSNLIEFPDQKVEYVRSSTSQTSSYQSVSLGRMCYPLNLKCWRAHADYYIDTFYDTTTTYSSHYVPQSVRSQLFVSSITSADAIFGNITTDYSQQSSEIFNDADRVGVMSKISSINSETQDTLPARSLLSYAVELKDPQTQNYLKSGLYPSLARYEIQLKNLTYKTVQQKVTQSGRTSSKYIPVDERNFTNVYNYNKTSIESQVLESILPKDVFSNIIVQNKIESPAGRGWHIVGHQKILNTNSNNIVIEESDGSVSTYELNNTISTLYKPSTTDVKLSQSVDLSSWPKAVFNYRANDGNNYVGEVDLSLSNPTVVGLGSIQSLTGQIANQGDYNCAINNYNGTFNVTTHPYKYEPLISGLIKHNSGRIFASDARAHRIFETGTQPFRELSGYKMDIESILRFYFGLGRLSLPTNELNDICTQIFGTPCGNPTVAQQSVSCQLVKPQDCPIGTFCKPWSPPTFLFSLGQGYFPFFTGDNQPGAALSNPDQIAFNNPQGMTISPDGEIVIADYGNNRIRKINLSTGTVSTIAGNGQNLDFPEAGGLAHQVPLYHPKSVIYDNQGNLLVSLEKGSIIRITPTFQATRVAGLPVALGGVVANQAHAQIIAMNNPSGMVIDSNSNFLYVADTGFHRVIRIDLSSNQADVVAGNGTCNPNASGDGAAATSAALCAPTNLGLDISRNLVINESGRNAIRLVSFTNSNLGNQLSFSPTNKDLSVLRKQSDNTWIRTLRDGSQIHFNSQGLQIASTDRLNRQNQYVYDNENRLQEIQLFTGQKIIYSYSGDLLTEITDAAGKTTEFRYSGNQLTRVIFPDSSFKSFEYSSNGMMLSETNAKGFKSFINYNEHNRLASVQLPDQTTVNANDYVSQSLPNNDESSNSTFTAQGFETNQNNSKITDSRGNSSYVVPDINGYISYMRDALGYQTTIKRDYEGLPKEIIRPNGQTLTFQYDSITRDLLETREKFSDDNSRIIKQSVFNSFGQVLSETDARGQTVTNTYNPSNGLLQRTTYPGNRSVEFQYNSYGFVTRRAQFPSSSETLLTEYTRNSNGWVTQAINPDNTRVNFVHDLAGNIIEKIENIDGTYQAITRYEYDTFNRLTKVTSPKNEATLYSYDLNGNLSTITDPRNQVTTFIYDNRDRVIRKTDAYGKIHEFNYDSNGNLISEKDPNGSQKSYIYDEMDRLSQATLPDDQFQYNYDQVGEILFAQNKNSSITHLRDSRGNITQTTTTGRGALVSYPTTQISVTYDENSNPLQVTTPVGTISYAYDELNRLNSMNAFGYSHDYTHDDSNRLTALTRGSLTTRFNYSGQKLQRIDHLVSGISRSFTEFTYNQRNYPTQKRSIASTTNYTYDPNGQLTTSSYEYSNEIFNYDPIGNRTSDQLTNYTYDSTAQRLNEDTFFNYQYDQNGNLLSKISKDGNKDSLTMAYSSQNQLVHIRIYTGVFPNLALKKEAYYSYDVLGRRMQKIIADSNSTTTRSFMYYGDNILAEFNQDNSLLARYTHSPLSPDDILSVDISTNGQSAGLSSQPGRYHYLKDHLNSVTDITDENGNVVQRFHYSAFGKIEKITSGDGVTDFAMESAPVRTSFTYTGRELDSESGLYYYRARYYDASIGRFLQVDPHPGKLGNPITIFNRYTYVTNRPTMMTDPKGEFGFLVAVLWGALYSVGISTIQAGIQTEWGKKGDMWEAFRGNFMVNFGFTLLGISFASLNGAKNTFDIGWGGVYTTADLGGKYGFSLGYFQSIPGSTVGSAFYWHEVGHSINFGLSGFFNDPERGSYLGTLGYFALTLPGTGPLESKWNPFSWAGEGSASGWGRIFSGTWYGLPE